MTVYGSGMGHARYTVRVLGAQTGCEATDWLSASSVRGMIASGIRSSQSVGADCRDCCVLGYAGCQL